MNEVITFFLRVVEKLSRNYIDGKIDLADYQIGFRQMLRRLYTVMLIAGRDGQRPSDIPPAKYLELANVLRRQYNFVEKFMRVVREGVLSEDQILARARLYVEAAGQMYWRGKTNVELPAYPRDGSSECAMHCMCSWELEYRNNEQGSPAYLYATWALGPTEHCPTCSQRSEMWNPLIIPLGV